MNFDYKDGIFSFTVSPEDIIDKINLGTGVVMLAIYIVLIPVEISQSSIRNISLTYAQFVPLAQLINALIDKQAKSKKS